VTEPRITLDIDTDAFMHHHQRMRTTLDIEDDVLRAAKELAKREGCTAGQVISALARRGLTTPTGRAKKLEKVRGGVPLLPSRGELVTLKHVREIMDREGV
jgi:hypothetical protein